MIKNEFFKLHNGVKIPKIGFGTWLIKDDIVAPLVSQAIESGYRHIDTAQVYFNERGVGEGIRSSKVAREEIFLTTKLDAGIKEYEKAKESIEKSLETLGVDYIDLMLIHSPTPWDKWKEGHFFEGNLAAYKALEEAYEAGKLKAIGVSNFDIIDLENLLENAKIKPMVNQVLTHIANTPFDIIQFCQKHDILVEAYSPIAHGEMPKISELESLAHKYNVSVAQLAIRYCLQLGTLPLPKSKNIEHINQNLNVDFEITAEDMETLKSIEKLKDYGDHSKFPVFSGK